jgi:glycosyltransferase involved in cell wall biosynthesis
MPFRSFRKDGVEIHPHRWIANALPAVLGEAFMSSLVLLSWQPFHLGPRQAIRRLGTFDVIQFEHCAYPDWMERLRGGARVVYSSHNVEVDYAAVQPRPAFVRSRVLQRVGKLESRAVHAADLLITCTPADANRMAELYGAPRQVEVIPNGIDSTLSVSDRLRERERCRASLKFPANEVVLLFVGGRAYHNRQAAHFLRDELMPKLGPHMRLLIAGECCRKSHDPDEKIRALGYVEDLRPFYAAADIGLNPVTAGSGSNIKVIDYLAAGLPVVTTPVGMRGYEALRHRLYVSGLDGFAAAIAAVEVGQRIAATEFNELTWTALGQKLYRTYTLLVDRTRSAAGA